MIVIKPLGLSQIKASLTDLERSQLPYAVSIALNRTARLAKEDTYVAMESKLHKPTWFIVPKPGPEREKDDKGALRIDLATKQKWQATVKLKDDPAPKQQAIPADPLLRHLFFGGARVAKGMEMFLRQHGLLKQGEYLTIGKNEPTNNFGNLSRGRWMQVKSQLELRTSGFDITPTKSKRSQKNQERAGRIFWSSGPGGSKPLVDMETGIAYGHTERGPGRQNNLPRGVWVRSGGDLHCVLKVVQRAPRYKVFIDLERIAQTSADKNFRREFRAAMKLAVRTAGKLGPNATHEERVADFKQRGAGGEGWQ